MFGDKYDAVMLNLRYIFPRDSKVTDILILILNNKVKAEPVLCNTMLH